MTPSGSSRAAVLTTIANLRAACIRAVEREVLQERLDDVVEALRLWCWLPKTGRRFYADVVGDALFEVVAELEEVAGVTDDERITVELSLWDAADLTQLLAENGSRATFVSKRRTKLRQSLVASAANDVERLIYRWADLLRPREAVCRSLPGPFRDDAQTVVDLLASLSLPRRAKVVAGKFQVSLSPLAQWAIKNRPLSEEADRSRGVIGRVRSPARPIALEAVHYARWLERVLSAPLESMPLMVGSAGVITIAGEAFGASPRLGGARRLG
jgi:hypothetical protein